MIDLHMHSTHSDGTDTVMDILKKAQEKNLSYISITDHNTCSAYIELQSIDSKKYYSGKIIPGIELNTTILGVPIEVLGYGIDIKLMQENLNGIYLSPKERNLLEIKRLYKKCLKAGIKLNSDFVGNYSPNIYASEYLHKIITQYEGNKQFIDDDAWNDSLVLYRKYMSDPNSIFFVDMNDVLPDLKSTIDLVKKSKGMLFLPHIFEYKHNSKRILHHILDTYTIDGIECYYSTFTEIQTQELLNLCKQRHLLISGGSDYHGKNSPGIEIGTGKGNLNIDDSVGFHLENLINSRNSNTSIVDR